jgi:taurine transport system permease protein
MGILMSKARGTRGDLSGWALSSIAVALAILAWFAFSKPSTSTTFPTPEDFLAAAEQITFRGYAGGTLLMHVLQSMKLALMGFAVAIAAAIPLGIAMGLDRRIDAIFEPIVALIRPVPPLAWVPIAIIWFGLGDVAKVFVIWFTAFVPSLINTHAGIRNVDPTLIAAARVHGAKGWGLLWDVMLPGALPMIFSGLRVSLQGAWMTLVAAELVGAFYGLGRVLSIAAQDIYPGMIVVAMVFVAVAGASMNKALTTIERIALPWVGVTS